MERDAFRLLRLPLETKIKKSKEIIRTALNRFPGDKLYVAWTGGKDSTVMLWLYYQVCSQLREPLPPAMFIDEGSVFEEIMELINRISKRWNVKVCIVKNRDVSDRAKKVGDVIKIADLNYRNRQEIYKLGYKGKSFPFEPESFLGNHLMKTVPMNIFLMENGVAGLSTAIRWDEQETRTDETYFSPRTDPQHTRVNPILHFRERDIWATIHKHDIPFCSLYHQGYRSLGAKSSTIKTSKIPAWKQDFENTPERAGRDQQKEQIMDRLRSLGYL